MPVLRCLWILFSFTTAQPFRAGLKSVTPTALQCAGLPTPALPCWGNSWRADGARLKQLQRFGVAPLRRSEAELMVLYYS